MAVTDRAAARSAPAMVVAHLGRWADARIEDVSLLPDQFAIASVGARGWRAVFRRRARCLFSASQNWSVLLRSHVARQEAALAECVAPRLAT